MTDDYMSDPYDYHRLYIIYVIIHTPALWLILFHSYYAQNYAGIIGSAEAYNPCTMNERQ